MDGFLYSAHLTAKFPMLSSMKRYLFLRRVVLQILFEKLLCDSCCYLISQVCHSTETVLGEERNVLWDIATPELQFLFLFLSASEPLARFHITEKSWVFRVTDLSEIPETLLIDKYVHSSSFSCFLNGTNSFVGQKSFQDHEAALSIDCGISSD